MYLSIFIVLFQKNEDGSVDISLQMRLYETEWTALDELLRSKTPISEDMYRRSVGYIENAIYQPSIADKVIMAWGEYVQVYLTEYKVIVLTMYFNFYVQQCHIM